MQAISTTDTPNTSTSRPDFEAGINHAANTPKEDALPQKHSSSEGSIERELAMPPSAQDNNDEAYLDPGLRSRPVAAPKPKRKKSFTSVPDHPTFWRHGEFGLVRLPRHQLPLDSAGCRWISYNKKYGVPKWVLTLGKKLLMTTDDSHPTRKFAILNELAEALKESMHNHFPSAIAKGVYYGLWTLTGGYLGVRNLVNAMDEHSFTAGIKKTLHDLLAAVYLPTQAVRLMCGIVNKTFKIFGTEKSVFVDLVRPLISYFTASFALSKLDPFIGGLIKRITPYTFDKVEDWIDSKARYLLGTLARTVFRPKGPASKISLKAV